MPTSFSTVCSVDILLTRKQGCTKNNHEKGLTVTSTFFFAGLNVFKKTYKVDSVRQNGDMALMARHVLSVDGDSKCTRVCADDS